MPEDFIEDFTDAGDPVAGDLMNIQRKESGVWVNYAAPVEIISGLLTAEATSPILSIGAGVLVVPAPAAGTANIPVFAYVKYTPGTVFDGSLFTIELVDGTTSVVYGFSTFNFGPAYMVSPVIAPGRWEAVNPGGGLFMSFLGGTLADGDITVVVQYQNVFI